MAVDNSLVQAWHEMEAVPVDNATEATAPAAFRSAAGTWLRRSAAAAGKEERPEVFDEIISAFFACEQVLRQVLENKLAEA